MLFDLLLQKIRCKTRITETDPRYHEITDCFLNIYDQTSRGIEDELAFFIRIFSFFLILKQENYFYISPKTSNRTRSRRFITDVLDYMELHYSEEITTADIAVSIGYSKSISADCSRRFSTRSSPFI